MNKYKGKLGIPAVIYRPGGFDVLWTGRFSIAAWTTNFYYYDSTTVFSHCIEVKE